MNRFKPDKIFDIKDTEDFNKAALEIFRIQYMYNSIYKDFTDSLGIDPEKVITIEKIPFLPISFFRTHQVLSEGEANNLTVFRSSSTTSQKPSEHFVSDIKLYEKSFMKGFELFYGNPQDYVILALLPGYLERKDSSLVYMFNHLIKESNHKESGFFLNNYTELKELLELLKTENKKVLLIGVTYALLDLSEMNISLNDNFIVMETGGMKGKRKEMIKEELHALLKEKFGVSTIHSEYGMTELLSQAYSKGNGLFKCPPWMKVIVRDTDDPLTQAGENRTGGINIIDLANVNSCSFIATQDLGRVNGNTFEVMGRFDNSDIRGCNLMVD